jgi:hypothetical protein
MPTDPREKLLAWIDERLEVCEAATPKGAWVARGAWVYPDSTNLSALAGIAQCRTRLHAPEIRKRQAETNAQVIAASRTLLPLVLKALRGECERHGLEPEWRDAEDIRKGCKRRCLCTDTYPCVFLRRLTAALLGESD